MDIQDYIIGLAEWLDISEKELIEVIVSNLKNPKNKMIMDDLYWDYLADDK